MVPQWERERAFYMAGVTQAEILDAFRDEVAAIAQGETSIPQAERRLGEMLAEIGYTPEPGQEGTIKDLRTWQRMRVALRTNVELLQGWADKERGMTRGAIMAAPAWELIRRFKRNVPRDNPAWEARFVIMGGEIRDGRMIAMKESLVWQELGNFEDGLGVDYPPFAWGSGMRWKEVGFREAKALGVIPDGWQPPPRRPVSSPNENLQTTPKVSEPALREALSKNLKGMAEWNKDTLVFTDPNGTRPLPAEKLVEIWGKGMPARFEDLPGKGLGQMDSALRWLGDHEEFRDANGTNAWDDLIRLANRITSRPVDTLWRGMAMSTEKLNEFLGKISKGYTVRPEFPLESWTASQAAAATYARTGGGGWSVMIRVANPRKAADFSALARAYSGKISKQPSPPVATESEWVFTTGRKFKVLRTIKDTDKRTVQITLEELP